MPVVGQSSEKQGHQRARDQICSLGVRDLARARKCKSIIQGNLNWGRKYTCTSELTGGEMTHFAFFRKGRWCRELPGSKKVTYLQNKEET